MLKVCSLNYFFSLRGIPNYNFEKGKITFKRNLNKSNSSQVSSQMVKILKCVNQRHRHVCFSPNARRIEMQFGIMLRTPCGYFFSFNKIHKIYQ